MEWWLSLLVIFGGLIFLMFCGMPIAFCFILVSVIGVFSLWGGIVGLKQMILSIYASVSTFTIMPLPLFVLMGTVAFHSGIAPNMIDTMDKWLGRVPGRLGLVAVGAGTLIATLTGASVASVAMLGSILTPEMEKRGYKKEMSLGPILGSGGLAIMIPPSDLAVLICAIGMLSVSKMLLGIIMPGLLMAVVMAVYIIIRCTFKPSLAPAYDVRHVPLLEKLLASVKYILPLGFIIFLVIGVIVLGIATPTEGAATGTLGMFILAACYRRLNLEVVKKSFSQALSIIGMMFMVMAGAVAFGQVLAFSGASREFMQFIINLNWVPIITVIAMQVVVLILGCFMSIIALIMIGIPLFLPVVIALGFDPIWFSVIYLLNVEIGLLTPPYGFSLFVMKAVAPPGTTMSDVVRAVMPFIFCQLFVMAMMIAFPSLVLWLPQAARSPVT